MDINANTYWAVVNPCAVQGIGKTREEAIADAKEFGDIDEVEDLSYGQQLKGPEGFCFVCPCSEKLYEEAQKNGGDFAFDWDDENNVLELWHELYE